MGEIMVTFIFLFLVVIFIWYGVSSANHFIKKRREDANWKKTWAAESAAEEKRMKDPVYRAQKEKDVAEAVEHAKERLRRAARERITATGQYKRYTPLTDGEVIAKCFDGLYPFSRWLMEEYLDGTLIGTTAKERERRALSKKVREAVWERDGGKCVECGSRENLHVDHIIPHSRGGSDTLENLQILCAKCNLAKGNRSIG